MANKHIDKRVCVICGRSSDDIGVHFSKKYNMTLCGKHWHQLTYRGKILEETMYTKNNIIIKEDHAEIELKDRNFNIVGYALIDIEDVEKCKTVKWALRRSKHTSYAYGLVNKKLEGLHRYILNYKGSLQIDHINRNGLDNRKNNLRIVTKDDNQINTDANGVICQNNRYGAMFQINKKFYRFGYYETYEEAKQVSRYFREIYLTDKQQFIEEYKKIRNKLKLPTYHIYHTNSNKWRPYLLINRKKKYLGLYNTLEEAIQVRDKAEKEYNSYVT